MYRDETFDFCMPHSKYENSLFIRERQIILDLRRMILDFGLNPLSLNFQIRKYNEVKNIIWFDSGIQLSASYGTLLVF